MSKTMLDTKVVETDKFLDLKPITRDLYTHLLLSSDDEGYVGNPKSVVRLIGAKETDLKTLIGEGFLHQFPSKVILILHYWNNNNHDTKNNKPTIFTEEKALVYEDESHVYRLKESPDIQTEHRLNTDCKETKKEPKYKERTNQQTNPVRLDGLPDDSIFLSLSVDDGISLQLECTKHNCDLRTLICYVDNSIKNRKEQTPIKNPYRYILQVAEGINWNPDENNRGYTPKGYDPNVNVIRYSDIEGSLWDMLSEIEQSNMKSLYQYEKYSMDEIIKAVDNYIKAKPQEKFKGTMVSLFKSIADKRLSEGIYIRGRGIRKSY